MTVSVTKSGTTWGVHCTTCNSQAFASFFRPSWILSATWAGAMILARWHVALHQAQQCPHCENVPSLPRPDVLEKEKSLLRFDGQLYVLGEDGVYPMKVGSRG